MHRLRFIGPLLTLQLAGAAFASPPSSIDMPDFSIKVLLADSAKRYLSERSESLVVDVTFADEIGPTGNYLGSTQDEAPGETTFAVRGLKFNPNKVRKLRTSDYEVLVNVYSGRRSIDMNVLDCGLVQDSISQLQRRTHEVHCKLGDWAPAKDLRSNQSLERTSTSWPRYAHQSIIASRGQLVPAPQLQR